MDKICDVCKEPFPMVKRSSDEVLVPYVTLMITDQEEACFKRHEKKSYSICSDCWLDSLGITV